jgi:hypothetical protein
MPQREDFYLEGLKDPTATSYDSGSRNMFEFRSFWLRDALIPSPSQHPFVGDSHPDLLYDTLIRPRGEYAYDSQGDATFPVRHTTGIASLAVGYPAGLTEGVEVDPGTGLKRTLGMSPYGRFACAEQGHIQMDVGSP